MKNRRTTPTLVQTALKGAAMAGQTPVAYDTHGGGFVRVYLTDPQEFGKLIEVDTTCDDIFETRSG